MAPYHLQDALYCSEEEDELEQDEGSGLVEGDMFWDDEELAWMLAREEQHTTHTPLCFQLESARREAVEWILKVSSHYSFSPLTSLLAANYLHRFLFTFSSINNLNKPWMTQLAAVASLSLAAKLEETHLPHLLDLQVEDCRYVFEAKTIKRMEILVLSTLRWKMNPVTPLSFLDYITRRLGLFNSNDFLTRSQSLLLSTLPDSRFMSYLPSVVATATMMHVLNGVEQRNQVVRILGTKKEKVDECLKLIWEQGNKKRKFGWVPDSPNGVMDVSFTSASDDSSNDSWPLLLANNNNNNNNVSSLSSSPEPKKNRTLLNPPNSSHFI
ncbi:cyclin-D3-2 [Arachis duranensis]|uniref:B-like cyclin n=1 Tax=Arachis duranensis TaxID=130453 RepID=A0A6P4B2T8_ARADU|nr:cyclin-D3-2 [Arachis duranensis]